MMRPRHFACLLALLLGGITLAPAAGNLVNVDLGDGGKACCLVLDGLGNVYVIGSVASASGTNVSVTKLDSANHVLSSFTFGGSLYDQPHAAALDPQGNLVIAGQTNSSDFPLVHALISQTEPNAPAGFVAKVNSSSGQILFSTRIGGLAAESFIRMGTVVNALAVDPAGNIYAAGSTNAADFPVSADAFQKSGAGGGSFGWRPFGFVLKLSPAGDRLFYSTLLGGTMANCFGGSHCIGRNNPSTTVNSIAVDRNGIATVGGATNAPDFPITAGAVQTVCRCQEYANNGFVTQLNAGGSGLLWSTFLGGTWYGFSQAPSGTNVINALAQDGAGNIVVAGITDADDFPTTPGVLQPSFASPSTLTSRPRDGFVSKLNPTGTALIFSTYLGGSDYDQINDVQIDALENLWVAGAFRRASFAQLSADGVRVLASQELTWEGQAIRTSGNIVVVLGVSGSVLQVPFDQVPELPNPLPPPLLPPGAVVNGASFAPGSNAVAPGTIVAIFGNNLTDGRSCLPPSCNPTFGSNGSLKTTMTGTQVTINGTLAPIFYSSPSQVGIEIPSELTGTSATVHVTVNGQASALQTIAIGPVSPGIFTFTSDGKGAGAFTHLDGSAVSAQNPAHAGELVILYATGLGQVTPSVPTGALPTGASATVAATTLTIDDITVIPDFAGLAGGFVGLNQVNVRLPANTRSASNIPVLLIIGGTASNPVTIAVQ